MSEQDLLFGRIHNPFAGVLLTEPLADTSKIEVSSKLNCAKQEATAVSAFHSMMGLMVLASVITGMVRHRSPSTVAFVQC